MAAGAVTPVATAVARPRAAAAQIGRWKRGRGFTSLFLSGSAGPLRVRCPCCGGGPVMWAVLLRACPGCCRGILHGAGSHSKGGPCRAVWGFCPRPGTGCWAPAVGLSGLSSPVRRRPGRVAASRGTSMDHACGMCGLWMPSAGVRGGTPRTRGPPAGLRPPGRCWGMPYVLSLPKGACGSAGWHLWWSRAGEILRCFSSRDTVPGMPVSGRFSRPARGIRGLCRVLVSNGLGRGRGE